MKRILALVAVLGVLFTAVAQRSLVTLSHNGELSFFSNLSALEDALEAAENGDTLYLSEGKFNASVNEITIKKRLSIVGSGYKSHILPNIVIDMTDNTDGYMEAPLFDGVRIQDLTFKDDSESRNNLNEVVISRCKIRNLYNGGYAGWNFNVDKCFIEYANFEGALNNITYIENSKIIGIGYYSSDQYGGIPYITVINCNISYSTFCPRKVWSSIIRSGESVGSGLSTPTATIKSEIYNSLLGISPTDNDVYIYECYIDSAFTFDENLEPDIDLAGNGYLGEDGTVVGVYGGESPFSENPSVPTVDSANSSVEYDAETNKLKVTIAVTPR